MNYQKFIKGFLFSIILFILYYFVCPYIFSLIFHKFIISDNTIIKSLALLGVYFFTFLIVFLFVFKDIRKDFKTFLKKPKEILNVGFSYWGYGLVVMIISNLIIISTVGNIATNEQLTQETLANYPLYMIPTIVFFGPWLEEIIFRLSLKKAFTKKLPYLLSSAIIFGSLHIISGIDDYSLTNLILHLKDWLFIIPYGALGFYFAKAYYETDNIFSSIIPHMLHNTFSVAIIIISNLIR